MKGRPTMIQPMGDVFDLISDVGGALGLWDTPGDVAAAEYKRQQQAYREQQAAQMALIEAQRQAAQEQAQLEARRQAAASRQMTQTIELVAIGVAGVIGIAALVVFSRKKK